MKLKSLVILASICVILGIAAYIMYQPNSAKTSQTDMGKQIFADLPVNDVAILTIQSTDGQIDLKKGTDQWVLEQRYGYSADFGQITDLVKKLRNLKVGRQFKASEETLARLALYSPENADVADDQKGTRITLKDKNAKVLADLIIGKHRQASAGYGGHYLTSVGSDTIYLVDQSFRYMRKKPVDWLDKNLLSVKSPDVEQVTCISPDNATAVYTLKRPEKKKAPEFTDLPDTFSDKKQKTNKMNTLFSALSGLRIDDIADPAIDGQTTGFDTHAHLIYRMFDGTIYTVQLGNEVEGQPEKYYLKVAVGYENPTPETSEKVTADATAQPEDQNKMTPVTDEKTSSDTETANADTQQINPEELKVEAERLNEKVGKWVYIIPKWKYNQFVTHIEDFFETEKDNPEK